MPGMYYPEFPAPDEDPDKGVQCNRCGTAAYWSDHYDAKGILNRRLFNANNHRLHACHTKLDEGAFPNEDA